MLVSTNGEVAQNLTQPNVIDPVDDDVLACVRLLAFASLLFQLRMVGHWSATARSW